MYRLKIKSNRFMVEKSSQRIPLSGNLESVEFNNYTQPWFLLELVFFTLDNAFWNLSFLEINATKVLVKSPFKQMLTNSLIEHFLWLYCIVWVFLPSDLSQPCIQVKKKKGFLFHQLLLYFDKYLKIFEYIPIKMFEFLRSVLNLEHKGQDLLFFYNIIICKLWSKN